MQQLSLSSCIYAVLAMDGKTTCVPIRRPESAKVGSSSSRKADTTTSDGSHHTTCRVELAPQARMEAEAKQVESAEAGGDRMRTYVRVLHRTAAPRKIVVALDGAREGTRY